jgi:L-fucose mutarotase/ribose pyranase (RbsD/FucU family)
MLKGVHPCIRPELLAGMGQGAELALAAARFPGHTINPRVLPADGLAAANP